MNTLNLTGASAPAAALCALNIDIQQVLHGNQERRVHAERYLMAVQDDRKTAGQLTVDVGPESGEIDAVLSASFEVADLPGTLTETSCLHVHLGEQLALSIFQMGDKYLVRPLAGMSFRPTVAEDGQPAFVLQCSSPPR